MALTKVGVVYSKTQKVVRRIIMNDTDDSYIDTHKNYINLGGEGWLDIPLDVFNQLISTGTFDSYLENIIGKATSDICAVIDGNDMAVLKIHADPIIDEHPDGVLIQDENAVMGEIYNLAGTP